MDKETEAILVPPEELMGEAMLALNERQRKFVCALLVFDCNMGAAYQYAGYGATNENSAQACASRLANSANVQAAIQEENRRRLNLQGSVIAVKRLVEKAMSGNVPAMNSILDRTGYSVKTEHTVNVVDDRSAKDVFAEVLRLCNSNNIPSLPSPSPVIEAEFTEIPDELKDLM